MNDLSEKITELLSDPTALEGIRNMASGLLGEMPNNTQTGSLPQDNIDIGRLMSVMGNLQKGKDDDRSRLLLALKPHLSEKRRQRVDRAVKILKLIDLLPLLQDSGLLNIL